MLEQRCGTLDCHGNTARPMRIFGSIGLRAPDPDHAGDPDYYPGGKTGTTDDFTDAWFVGFDPDITVRCVISYSTEMHTMVGGVLPAIELSEVVFTAVTQVELTESTPPEAQIAVRRR